jgi:hypothetical protein
MGRGAKPTIWLFSDAQKAVIDSKIPEFEEQVRKLNPDWQAHKKDLTKAKQDIAVPLVDSDLFRPLWDTTHPDHMSEAELDGIEGNNEAIKRRNEGGRKGWLEVRSRCHSGSYLLTLIGIGYHASLYKPRQQQNEAQRRQKIIPSTGGNIS